MSHNYVENNIYKALGIDNNFNWFLINHFSKPVNNNKD